MLPPVDLQGRRTVIDLTADDQPEVIDVDALPDRPNSYFGEDINVIYARRVQQHQHQMRNPAPVDPIEPYFIEPRSRPMPNLGNPIMMGGARVGSQIGNGDIGRRPGSNELVGEFVRALLPGMLPGMREWLGSPLRNAGGPWTYRHQSIDINFQAPGNLDYRLGPNGREFTPPVNEAARQRELEYKAPVKCQEGFTRDPKEDELLVCPGCDAELGVTSKENEAQGTVWVGKCGHVSLRITYIFPWEVTIILVPVTDWILIH